MEPRIELFEETRLIGLHATLSLGRDATPALWRSFMPRRNEIVTAVSDVLYSLQQYPAGYFNNFDPATPFEKWAAREVDSFDSVPEGMDALVVPRGAYAVFLHRGPASEGARLFAFIFNEWLPKSDYMLDERPHFEKLDHRYKNEDPGSEEEIWIPIRRPETNEHE